MQKNNLKKGYSELRTRVRRISSNPVGHESGMRVGVLEGIYLKRKIYRHINRNLFLAGGALYTIPTPSTSMDDHDDGMIKAINKLNNS